MTEVLTGALYDGEVGGGGSYVVAKVGVDLPGSLLPGRRCTFAGGKSARRRRRRENLSTFATVLMNFIDIFIEINNQNTKISRLRRATITIQHLEVQLWKFKMICRELKMIYR